MKKKIDPEELAAILQLAMNKSHESPVDLGIDEAILDVDLHALALVPVRERPPITPADTKSEKISIRIQSVTLAAIRQHAQELGVPYQRLINQKLREAMATLPSSAVG
nr:CopG family antitoxin [uncultured Rhodoferax sp.]